MIFISSLENFFISCKSIFSPKLVTLIYLAPNKLMSALKQILFSRTFYGISLVDSCISRFLLKIYRKFLYIQKTIFFFNCCQNHAKFGDILYFTQSILCAIGDFERRFSRQITTKSPIFLQIPPYLATCCQIPNFSTAICSRTI